MFEKAKEQDQTEVDRTMQERLEIETKKNELDERKKKLEEKKLLLQKLKEQEKEDEENDVQREANVVLGSSTFVSFGTVLSEFLNSLDCFLLRS